MFFYFLRTTHIIHTYIHTFRPAVDIFPWLSVIETSSFLFSLGGCTTNFFPPKYLRPLVPECDIVAGNTNEGGVQDYGTAEWMDYLPIHPKSVLGRWDGMGYLFLFFSFSFFDIRTT